MLLNLKNVCTVLMLLIIVFSIACGENKDKEMDQSIYDFTVLDINNKEVKMSEFKGDVLLIVNVASYCGYTKQYEGLQELYSKFSDKGFKVLGFPCNQFGEQEPGTNEEIVEFCSVNYGVTFPLFSKIDVNGENAHPLYKYLTKIKTGTLGTEPIKWNFAKFLVDRDGNVIERYGHKTTPESIESKIAELLKK